MGDRKFEHGLGLHAPCTALLLLDGNTEKFHAVVGVSDLKGEPGSVEFVVTGDGKILFRSGVMKGGVNKAGDPPKEINLALSGVKKLKLEVTDGGDNNYSDHANFADAVFTWKGAAPKIVDMETYGGQAFPPVGTNRITVAVQAADAPWVAKWIGPEKGDANTWICYRKSFEMGRVPSSVPTRVAVDSKYWLWINGKLVVREGGLKRGPTPTDGYYDVVELAPYLKKGRNTIAVLAWYFGKPGFSHKSSGKPGFVLEATLDKGAVATDKSWKMRIHPAFGTAGEPKPNYRLPESSVLFDATKDIGGWMEPSYDDSSWSAPVESGTPPVAPWGALVRRPIPQWKDYGLKAYTNAAALPVVSDGKAIKAALPYNAQVTPYFKIEAKAGLKIDIRTDDIQGGGETSIHAEYLTRNGVQEYEAPGWMNGHVVEYTMPAGVKILSLQYRETGYNAEFVGSFKCEEPFYNSLWEKSKRTLYVTMRDNYMDCPDRERAQWWGDAVNELGEAFYVFDPPGYQLAQKAILELANWQRANKTLYSPVPSGNWGAELPPQMLASVGKYGFWVYYFYTGDSAAMRAVYRDYLTVWKQDENGLVIHRKGDWDWSDWGSNIDVRLLDSVWYHLALQGAIEMAKLCGAEGDLPGWQARLKAVGKGVNAACWNGKEYRSSNYSGDTDDRGNGLAVVAGIAGSDKYAALREVLDKHRNASPYMEKYVLEALFMMGESQLGLDRMKQRYDGMVKRPISTLAENMDGSGTYNHAWSGGPLTMMSQYVLGVAPDKVAYSEYHVLPQMGALRSVEAMVPTVKGNIQVSLKRDAATFGLKLVSPKGTKALVGIPLEKGRRIASVEVNGKTVWQNGKPDLSARGLVCKGQDERYCQFEVGPGKWDFSASYE
ncbi:MAG: NPCBM/NEW2 domain-containing protein [Kiritimatiellaeota bacterium]|nr:NPCBM/NEW2 domain-containing protein [Kiritimatiellota bacterium]